MKAFLNLSIVVFSLLAVTGGQAQTQWTSGTRNSLSSLAAPTDHRCDFSRIGKSPSTVQKLVASAADWVRFEVQKGLIWNASAGSTTQGMLEPVGWLHAKSSKRAAGASEDIGRTLSAISSLRNKYPLSECFDLAFQDQEFHQKVFGGMAMMKDNVDVFAAVQIKAKGNDVLFVQYPELLLQLDRKRDRLFGFDYTANAFRPVNSVLRTSVSPKLEEIEKKMGLSF